MNNGGIVKYRRAMFVTGLFVVDAVIIALALYAAEQIRFHLLARTSLLPHMPHEWLAQTAMLAALAYLPALWGVKLYEMRRGWGHLELMFSVLIASGLGVMGLLALSYLFKEFWYSRMVLWLFVILSWGGLVGVRLLTKSVLLRCFKHGIGVLRLVIVGESASAQSLATRIRRNPQGGLRVVGQLVASGGLGEGTGCGSGRLEEAFMALQRARPHICLFAEPIQGREEMAYLLAKCQEEGIDVWLGTDWHRRFSPRMELKDVEAVPVVVLGNLRLASWERLVKRAVDVVGAAALLLLSAPLMLVAAIQIRREIGRPVIFRQKRVGFQGRPFTIFKLRALADGVTGRTPFCDFLRAYSLDELPQLWNVLRGEMSLVGPRPETPERVRRYNPWNRRRLQVMPGITGLAQIAGVRGEHGLSTKSRFDVRYLENQSLILDLGILLRTPFVVLSRWRRKDGRARLKGVRRVVKALHESREGAHSMPDPEVLVPLERSWPAARSGAGRGRAESRS